MILKWTIPASLGYSGLMYHWWGTKGFSRPPPSCTWNISPMRKYLNHLNQLLLLVNDGALQPVSEGLSFLQMLCGQNSIWRKLIPAACISDVIDSVTNTTQSLWRKVRGVKQIDRWLNRFIFTLWLLFSCKASRTRTTVNPSITARSFHRS